MAEWRTINHSLPWAGLLCLLWLSVLLCSSCAAPSMSGSPGAEINQLKLQLEAKSEILTAKGNELNAFKARIETLNARIGVLQLDLQAGGDINSTIALIVAIGATPLCFVVYMVSERFGLGRKVKAVFKGPCKRDAVI